MNEHANPATPMDPEKPTLWKLLKLTAERWYPVVFALAAAVGVAVGFKERPVPQQAQQLMASTIDLGAIAIGFLATALAVLLSIQGSKNSEFSQQSGLYQRLVRYILWAIQGAFLLAALSLITVLLDPMVAEAEWRRYGFAAWIFALVLTGLSCYRVITIFFIVMTPDDPKRLRPR